jgi:hypothetical protein
MLKVKLTTASTGGNDQGESALLGPLRKVCDVYSTLICALIQMRTDVFARFRGYVICLMVCLVCA